MSAMIERVALAIWRKREEDFPERVKRCTPDNIDRATGAWQQVLVEARAAIEAMREPDDAMVNKAWSMIRSNLRYEEVYRHLIDAALAEPAPGVSA